MGIFHRKQCVVSPSCQQECRSISGLACVAKLIPRESVRSASPGRLKGDGCQSKDSQGKERCIFTSQCCTCAVCPQLPVPCSKGGAAAASLWGRTALQLSLGRTASPRAQRPSRRAAINGRASLSGGSAAPPPSLSHRQWASSTGSVCQTDKLFLGVKD